METTKSTLPIVANDFTRTWEEKKKKKLCGIVS